MRGVPDSEIIRSRPWRRSEPPGSILVIRLQALGDLVITLPYAQALRRRFPLARLELVTREEVADVARAVTLFDEVHVLGGGRSPWLQLVAALRLAPALARRPFDVVVDLQNNRVSRLVRRLLRPEAWSAFDRFSPLAAGERTRRTLEAAGLALGAVTAGVSLRDPEAGATRLAAAGLPSDEPFVVLNPAGAWRSRHWPLASYVAFARLWRERRGGRFVALGPPPLAARVGALKQALGDALVDLVGRTSVAEAFGIVSRAGLVLTEDSGLMHMAWVLGTPTLALFGSSRADWSRPLGNARCLDSADLPCGACMEAECRFGDVRCLTRYTPELILGEAEGLVARTTSRAPLLDGAGAGA